MPQNYKPYFSEKEAAAYLNISLSTIRRWRKAATGPEHFHFGGVLRYAESALEDFAKKHTIPAA